MRHWRPRHQHPAHRVLVCNVLRRVLHIRRSDSAAFTARCHVVCFFSSSPAAAGVPASPTVTAALDDAALRPRFRLTRTHHFPCCRGHHICLALSRLRRRSTRSTPAATDDDGLVPGRRKPYAPIALELTVVLNPRLMALGPTPLSTALGIAPLATTAPAPRSPRLGLQRAASRSAYQQLPLTARLQDKSSRLDLLK